MPDRNFAVGIVGNAMKAFQAGRFQEAEKFMNEFETMNRANISAGAMGLQQAQHQLQERRFEQGTLPLTRETIATSQQQRQLGEFRITEAERLQRENDRLGQEAAEMRSELEQFRKTEGTTPIRERARGQIATEEFARVKAKTGAELEPRRAKAVIRESETKAKLQEAQAEAAEIQRKGAESPIDRTRRVLTELEYPEDKVNRIVEFQTLTEAGVRRTIQDLSSDVTEITKAISAMETRPTVTEVLGATLQAGKVEQNAARWLADMLGGQDAILTAEQKKSAVEKLRRLRTELVNQHNAIPGVQPINVEPTVGGLSLNEAVGLTEEFVATLQQANRTALTPDEETSLRNQGLEIFIPIINNRLQTETQTSRPIQESKTTRESKARSTSPPSSVMKKVLQTLGGAITNELVQSTIDSFTEFDIHSISTEVKADLLDLGYSESQIRSIERAIK